MSARVKCWNVWVGTGAKTTTLLAAPVYASTEASALAVARAQHGRDDVAVREQLFAEQVNALADLFKSTFGSGPPRPQ